MASRPDLMITRPERRVLDPKPTRAVLQWLLDEDY
jgi:hypothetical protein